MASFFYSLVFLREDELFQRGWGGGGVVFVTLVENPERLGGGHQFPAKMENPGRWWGGLSEIPSVMGVWILSGTTQSLFLRIVAAIQLAWKYLITAAQYMPIIGIHPQTQRRQIPATPTT